MTNANDLFTSKEVCIFLKISPVTLWRLRKAGRVTFRRVASKIVYLRVDVDEYLERTKREAISTEEGKK
jgi:hypothetical protein